MNRTINKWTWWAGSSEEVYSTECSSREEAQETVIEEYGEGWICEAITSPIKLDECFDAHRFIEDLENDKYDEWVGENGDTVLDIDRNQMIDLQDTVRTAIKSWQDKHELTFHPFLFSSQRNVEYIPQQETTS